eukprot:124038-Amphidinium_carterae.1
MIKLMTHVSTTSNRLTAICPRMPCEFKCVSQSQNVHNMQHLCWSKNDHQAEHASSATKVKTIRKQSTKSNKNGGFVSADILRL